MGLKKRRKTKTPKTTRENRLTKQFKRKIITTNKAQIPTKLPNTEATIADLKDKYLRQAAEFDNYRKRVLKEKSELIQNGGESVISSLLPIIDDFERALQNMKKSDDTAALKEGVELIFRSS